MEDGSEGRDGLGSHGLHAFHIGRVERPRIAFPGRGRELDEALRLPLAHNQLSSVSPQGFLEVNRPIKGKPEAVIRKMTYKLDSIPAVTAQ